MLLLLLFTVLRSELLWRLRRGEHVHQDPELEYSSEVRSDCLWCTFQLCAIPARPAQGRALQGTQRRAAAAGQRHGREYVSALPAAKYSAGMASLQTLDCGLLKIHRTALPRWVWFLCVLPGCLSPAFLSFTIRHLPTPGKDQCLALRRTSPRDGDARHARFVQWMHPALPRVLAWVTTFSGVHPSLNSRG